MGKKEEVIPITLQKSCHWFFSGSQAGIGAQSEPFASPAAPEEQHATSRT